MCPVTECLQYWDPHSMAFMKSNYFKFAAVNDATCTWSGQLPPRCQNNAPLSCKIFLGGVPWDIGEQTLYAAFKPFGNIRYDNLVTSSCTMTPRKHRK